ncbi:MAG: S24/S26 family peptidase [Candidatus Micrarchaeota archaeon]|nr:S24/S26 family peptidase [Candidatus Micrarchaeota archaeon]
MFSKNLEKIKVLEGNDMFPSIDPREFLLLDRAAKPSIGDVIVFENRLGMRIAHRLIYRLGEYYFAKGDNCPCFDLPIRERDIVGVVIGKSKEAERNRLGELFLGVFLVYYLACSRLFDSKKKGKFITLRIVSMLYPYIPLSKKDNEKNK